LAVLDGAVVAVAAGVWVVLRNVVFADPRVGGGTGVGVRGTAIGAPVVAAVGGLCGLIGAAIIRRANGPAPAAG
jgi:hypothetical protein